MTRERHLTRCDYPKARGWWVRIQRRGQKHQRYSADAKHGGKGRARLAAIEWRDRRLERLPRERAPRPRVWREGHTWRGRYCGGGRVSSIHRSARVHGARRAEALVRTWARRCS